MRIEGSFLTLNSETATVVITIATEPTKAVEIGSDTIMFDSSPVEIRSSVNDTFDTLLRSDATVRLLLRNYMPEFFQTNACDASVEIKVGDKCVFFGYLEPLTLSQPYNSVYDTLSLNCVDALSSLQYSRYGNVGRQGISYDAVKMTAAQKTVYEILTSILRNAGLTGRVYYDGSRTIGGSDIFNGVSINEALFMGSDEDSIWTQDKVIEEILRYFNLHIMQDGHDVYIFSWDTIKGSGDITWTDIKTGYTATMARTTHELTTDIVADTDATITIGDVYNQIVVKCSTEGVDTVIESPLDTDGLTSPYNNKQKYLTEYSTDLTDGYCYSAFAGLIRGQSVSHKSATVTEWYVRVKDSRNWVFPKAGDIASDLVNDLCHDKRNQHALPDYLSDHTGAALLSFGKVERNTLESNRDNSPVSKVDMTDCLVVSVNGNGDDTESGTFPNESSLKTGNPVAVYTGRISGGVYSPSDDAVTNYLVISGSMILNPVMKDSGKIDDLLKINAPIDLVKVDTVPSRQTSNGRLYTRRWWHALTPAGKPTAVTDYGLMPYTGDGPQEYEFNYSAISDGNDHISKIGVLACMLIIGDKCLVETGTSGKPSDFAWKPYKSREACSDDDEYYAQCFTIGFDPKIGDKLVGTEFSIQNNVDYTMGLDAEGIAIPIKKSDSVNGAVSFMILGPVNITWDVITRRHPTWFRHTKWTSTSIPLLAHVSSIVIREFEIKVYSDNGLNDMVGNDDDLVYMSDEESNFFNRKDDIEFKLTSALTSAECLDLGVNDSVKISTPLDLSTGVGVLAITDTVSGVTDKPERLYVDSYYREYSKPRVLLGQTLDDTAEAVGFADHYHHPALGKDFYVVGISRNLEECTARIDMKEVWP